MQSWCKICPLNGSRRIRAKTKLHTKPREACKSSWSPTGILKSFILTIPWNSAKLVKISPGIIARLHHNRSETNGIAERAVRRVKEGTSAVLLQSGLTTSRNLCHTLFIFSHMHSLAQDLSLVINISIVIHERTSLSRFSSSTSTCPFLSSSFPSTSCTASCTLSSTT